MTTTRGWTSCVTQFMRNARPYIFFPDYFPGIANTRRRETGAFEVVAEKNMAAKGKLGKDAQTAKKR